MKCSRTHFSRIHQYHRMADGAASLQRAILQYLRGIYGTRRVPLTEDQIVAWFRNTDADMVRINLLALSMQQRVVRQGKVYSHPGDFAIAHYYPNGDLLERTHYESEDAVRAEAETMRRSGTLVDGEQLVLLRREQEFDRIVAG